MDEDFKKGDFVRIKNVHLEHEYEYIGKVDHPNPFPKEYLSPVRVELIVRISSSGKYVWDIGEKISFVSSIISKLDGKELEWIRLLYD